MTLLEILLPIPKSEIRAPHLFGEETLNSLPISTRYELDIPISTRYQVDQEENGTASQTK